MEDYGQFTVKTVVGASPLRDKLRLFLEARELRLEADVEFAYLLCEGSNIAACACLAGKMVKCVAVAPEYEGMGLAARVVSGVVEEAYARGQIHLFVCTKPHYVDTFRGLGFKLLAMLPGRAAFLENDPHGLERFLKSLAPYRREGKSGAMVVNVNPFTKGHRHLVEYAASRCDTLHIFLVREDRSEFPTQVRLQLLKEGTADLPNVIVHEGGQYVLSSATFPSYFLKDIGQLAETYAGVDALLFAQSIAPALNITARFVGQEPLSPTTEIYNQVLSRVLPAKGIDVEIIDRLCEGDAPISASSVRRLFAAGKMEELRALVPETTYRFLASAEGEKIAQKIREKEQAGA